jgi:hypothetical protein
MATGHPRGVRPGGRGPARAITPTDEQRVAADCRAAWLLAAALTGYLAFLQLQFSAATEGRLAEEARNLAIGNGLSAAITVFFGAKLLDGSLAPLPVQFGSVGAIRVTWAVIQVMQGRES